MDRFLSNEEEQYDEKISLDELYDRKREVEINRMNIYKKILNRVHVKIKTAARQKNNESFTFFVVPEFQFGVPKYDVHTCCSYIIEKLEDNGFMVKYTHPNLIYIYWGHYIPSYRRAQIKEKTGYSIDGFGNIIKEKQTNKKTDVNALLITDKEKQDDTTKKSILKPSKQYKDISSYKPNGIYNIDLISKINDKVR